MLLILVTTGRVIPGLEYCRPVVEQDIHPPLFVAGWLWTEEYWSEEQLCRLCPWLRGIRTELVHGWHDPDIDPGSRRPFVIDADFPLQRTFRAFEDLVNALGSLKGVNMLGLAGQQVVAAGALGHDLVVVSVGSDAVVLV